MLLAEFARRDEIVLATKVCGVMRQGPNGRGLSRKAIMHEIDAEPPPARHRLRRPLPDPSLGLPHADRGDDGGAARRREGGQGPLHRRVVDVGLAVREGAARGRAARLDEVRLDAEPLQPPLPRGGARDAAAVSSTRASASSRGARSPAACSPATPAPRPIDPRPTSSARSLYANADAGIIEAVAKIAADRGVSRAQIALAWVSKHPAVTAPIVGVTKPHQLEDAIASVDIELTADEISALESPYTPQPVQGFA